MSEQTPLMRQYWSIKNLHPDKIVLFRMGDFYEMFFDDAVTAAPILGIALTARNKKAADETPMCGVPHFSIAGPINKLLAAGLKVALCEQVEDPKTAKGIVRREVTRVLTPGMVYDPESLESHRPCYLVGFSESAVACVDSTTGESLLWQSLAGHELRALLQSLPVAEVVLSEGQSWDFGGSVAKTMWVGKDESMPEPLDRLVDYLKQSGLADAARAAKEYRSLKWGLHLELSARGLQHLEIFQTSQGKVPGSLFHALDRTVTAMGARLLRSRLAFPWTDPAKIESSWQQIQDWIERAGTLKETRKRLLPVGDLERRTLKVSLPTANARDLLSLGQSLHSSFEASDLVGIKVPRVIEELSHEILHSLREELPVSVKQGGMFRQGVDARLDEALEYSTQGHRFLQEFEERQKLQTQIPSLKVRYNQVFGYYLEVTHAHKDKVPGSFVRKQTLANAERYTNEELLELERKILSAEVKQFELESFLFEELRKKAIRAQSALLAWARDLAELDVTLSSAWLAMERNYVRPQWSQDQVLRIQGGLHPVLEQMQVMVPNACELDPGRCVILTGPNMAGKSTYMRQVALLCLMAQAGLWVPARKMECKVLDAILTRIGAHDSLHEGLSTFMVEMQETASLLERATENSLLILDEIGRGTSTYDGMSLARALVEHLVASVRARVLFATHYHELTDLSASFPAIANAHMAIQESRGELKFLFTLRSGPALKSYGIQVARKAHLPKAVIDRAQEILKEMEGGRGQLDLFAQEIPKIVMDSPQVDQARLDFDESTAKVDPHQLQWLGELKDLELNSMTPIEALLKLEKWKSRLEM